jgi:hypothetical protein
MNQKQDELDIPYPPGHNWEGFTLKQISEAYKQSDKKNGKEN